MSDQKIIFMVGPDRCGKTEISHELSKRLNVPYFKASSEHTAFLTSKEAKNELFLNQLKYADPRVCDLLRQTGHSIIFDRGFPCEWVYSTIFQRNTDKEFLLHMDKQWAKIDAKIIMCHRSSYEGIVDDLDESINSSMLKKIDHEYREYLTNFSKCQHLFLNVDSEDLNQEISEINKFLNVL